MNLRKPKNYLKPQQLLQSNYTDDSNNATKPFPNKQPIDNGITQRKPKPSKSRAKTFGGVFSCYTKLHYVHQLKYDSLFLAVDIFLSYIEKQTISIKKQAFMKLGMTAFMIAIKIEEIYPPTFDQISKFFNLSGISLTQYIDLEFSIITRLDFNLNFSSPARLLFEDTKQCYQYIKGLPKYDMFQVYLFLELAICDPQTFLMLEVSKEFSFVDIQKSRWSFIMKSINFIYSPLAGNQKQDFDIVLCSKKLIIAKTNLENNHMFLSKKYSMPRFGCATLSQTYKPVENQSKQDEIMQNVTYQN